MPESLSSAEKSDHRPVAVYSAEPVARSSRTQTVPER
jgi:hypothetical protein